MAPDDSEHEFHEVVDRLLSTLLWLAATLGFVALVGALVRWVEQGWHPRYAVHITVYFAILAALVAGRRVSRVVRSAAVVGLIAVNGVSKLYWDGPVGTGSLALAVACILVGAFIGKRAAMIGVVGALLAIVLAGAGYISGFLPLPLGLESALRSPAQWFGFAATFAVFTVAALLSVAGIQQALRGLVTRLNERTGLLRDRERHYRLLAENTDDVVFCLDLDLKPTYISPSAQRLFGYDATGLSGIRLRDVFAPESFQLALRQFTEDVARIEQRDAEIPLLEYEFVRKEGSRFWGELRMSAVRDEGGRLSHFQGMLRDVTDRRRAEAERECLRERLLETERLNALGQLAGGVAHDFNNQLGGILGFADLIGVAESPAETREYAENIARCARRAADLTGQLLAFARKGRCREESVDVHALVSEVTSVLERSIDKHIRIRCDLSAAQAIVSGDASLLQNALLNVALNARDALPNGGELAFTTSLEPGSGSDEPEHPGLLVIRITDTGTGMDTETQKHVFEPFFTTKEPGRGTGMGLAAVYGTMQSHGGSVELESAPGQGTTVTLRLPLSERRRPLSDAPREALVRGTGHILVVDDEPVVRRMTRRALEVLGYRVMSCGTARDALAMFERSWQTLDLVLLDMVLPDTSGPELFAALRRIDAGAKVLFMSGYSAHGSTASLVEQGAAGFVQKPFRLGELSEKVAELLAQRALA